MLVKAFILQGIAVLIMIITYKILDWSVEEIHLMDAKICNILTSVEGFHTNNDIDKL